MKTSTELPISWTFWMTKIEGTVYEIESIAQFSTVEEFWNIYLQLPSVNKIKHCNLCLFKNGIKPAWEHEMNRGGMTVRLKSFPITDESWQHLLLATIGGSLEESMKLKAPLCGISLVWNEPKKQLHVEMWFGKGFSKKGEGEEKEILAKVLNIKKNSIVFKPNK